MSLNYVDLQKSVAEQIQIGDIYNEVQRLKEVTSHIPVLARQEPQALQKAWRTMDTSPPARGPKAAFFDPLSLQYAMGYKDRRYSLTYDTLRRITSQVSVIAAIINTRIAQIAGFCQPYRQSKSLGFVVKHKDPEHATTASERRFIQMLETFIANCGDPGRPNPFFRYERDDFEGFVRKIVRDTLTYDQVAFEIVPRKNGMPFEFWAIDASTIRIASSEKDIGISWSHHARNTVGPLFPSRFQGLYPGAYGAMDIGPTNSIQYVQVVNGQIENVYTTRELAFGVRNPRTDIYTQGYGFGEPEQMVTIITSLLHSEEYNKRYFCTAPGTLVTTEMGLVPVEELVGDRFRIWNGREWRPATAYATGNKPLVTTKLWNGLEIETSPIHKFRIIPRESDTGDVIWAEQRALKKGDVVLTGYHRTDPKVDIDDLLKVGEKYDTDHYTGNSWTPTEEVVRDSKFWEMIGFSIGDGYWPDLAEKSVQWMKIFPHYEKDKELFDRFLSTCAEHGIGAGGGAHNKHVVRQDGEAGYPAVRINHKCFLRWLSDLGFRSSGEGKRLPSILFKLPAWIREAVLRGLFSADGHRVKHQAGYCTPTVYSSGPRLRQDILRCLWSVGVAANEVGEGLLREGTISVQDVPAFVEKIGYLQPYKNEGIERSESQALRWDTVHQGFAKSLAQKIRRADGWHLLCPKERDLLCKVSRGVCGISRPRLISAMKFCKMEIPEALYYHHVAVDHVDLEPREETQMFDIEVFDDDHLFLANNMAVHNTNGAHPKGLLNFKGDNWTPDQLEAFRRQWIAQAAGVENAWKTPITQSEGIEWVNLQMSNKDMEFGQWIEYLIKVVCGVYLMDPAEINFDLHGGVQQTPLFESSQEWKLKASRDRGLRPLLRFIAKLINKHIISRIDDHFVFEFAGLDELTEQEKHEMLKEQIGSYMTLNEGRRSLDLDDVELGDIPLNPVYVQVMQMKQQEEQQQRQEQQEQEQQQQQMAMQQQQAGQPQLDEQGQPIDAGGVPPEEEAPQGSQYTANFGKSQSQEIVIKFDDWKDLKRQP